MVARVPRTRSVMRLVRESLWRLLSPHDVPVYLGIPVSFSLSRCGLAIIDRGFAHEIRTHFRGIERRIGKVFRHARNRRVRMLNVPQIFTFPIKATHADEEISSALLARSTRELRNLAIALPEFSFVLPAPGIGYGRREWRSVEGVLGVLPDNVTVVRR